MMSHSKYFLALHCGETMAPWHPSTQCFFYVCINAWRCNDVWKKICVLENEPEYLSTSGIEIWFLCCWDVLTKLLSHSLTAKHEVWWQHLFLYPGGLAVGNVRGWIPLFSQTIQCFQCFPVLTKDSVKPTTLPPPLLQTPSTTIRAV